MTRTPTISVTAIAIAARAFAWDIPGGAQCAEPTHSVSPMPPLLSFSP